MFDKNVEILIVDDMKGVRLWLSKTLQSMGYAKIKEANDGEEALAMLKANSFGLVFSDIVMPKKNGIDLIKDMSQDPQLAKVPVIVLSAETDRDMILTAVNLGAATYIIKPATQPVLQKKMAEAFAKKSL